MKQTIGYPLLVAAIATVALANANLYVWRLQFHRPWQTPSKVSTEMLWQNHSMRGWPISVGVSSQRISDRSGAVTYNARFSAPLGLATIWAGDASDIARLNGIALAINLVVGILVVIGCFLAASAICKRAEWTLRFSLRSLLLVTGICAVVFAIREDILVIQALFDAVKSLPNAQAFLRIGTPGIINIALCLALVWCVVTIWRCTVDRRRNQNGDEIG